MKKKTNHHIAYYYLENTDNVCHKKPGENVPISPLKVLSDVTCTKVFRWEQFLIESKRHS